MPQEHAISKKDFVQNKTKKKKDIFDSLTITLWSAFLPFFKRTLGSISVITTRSLYR